MKRISWRLLSRAWRLWRPATLTFVTAVALVWIGHFGLLEEIWQSWQAVDALHDQLVAAAPTNDKALRSATESGENAEAQPHPVQHSNSLSATDALSAIDSLAWLPGQSDPARIWPEMQHLLVQRGLALLSLRPLPESRVAPLPSQAVALRMTGSFDDWVGAWAALNEHGPVWSMERLSIRSQEGSASVEIDAQLRLWLKKGADGAQAWSGRGGVSLPAPRTSVTVFGGGKGQRASAKVLASSSIPLTDAGLASAHAQGPHPQHWPRAGLRLVGLWQMGQDRQAVLASGPWWAVVQLNQRVSLEGHRLYALGDRSVTLRLGSGPIDVLTFDKESP